MSRADVQGYESVRQSRQDLRREMEARSGRRNRARLLCENRLVTRRIFVVAGAIEIGRQGNLPRAIRIDRALEPHETLAFIVNSLHASGRAVEHRRRAEAHLASRFHEAFPGLRIDLFEKQELNRAVVGKTPGRQNASVVEHKKIARPNELG